MVQCVRCGDDVGVCCTVVMLPISCMVAPSQGFLCVCSSQDSIMWCLKNRGLCLFPCSSPSSKCLCFSQP